MGLLLLDNLQTYGAQAPPYSGVAYKEASQGVRYWHMQLYGSGKGNWLARVLCALEPSVVFVCWVKSGLC